MEESRLVYPRNKSLSQPPSRRPEPTETGLTSLATATHQAITWSKTSMIVADIQLEKLVNLSNNKPLSKEKEEALAGALIVCTRSFREIGLYIHFQFNWTNLCIH